MCRQSYAAKNDSIMETKADIANTSNQASNIILFSSSCDGWERAGVSKGI